MPLNTNIDLKVPYAEKEQAKVHGACRDLGKTRLYAMPLI
jgi:hypothetical protein